MEKRALLAIGLSCLVLVIWTLLFPPKPVPPPRPSEATGGATTAAGSAGAGGPMAGEAKPEPGDAAATGLVADKGRAGKPEPGEQAGGPASARNAAPPKREAPEGAAAVLVLTDLARIEISNPGGKLTSWTLKKYLDTE